MELNNVSLRYLGTNPEECSTSFDNLPIILEGNPYAKPAQVQVNQIDEAGNISIKSLSGILAYQNIKSIDQNVYDVQDLRCSNKKTPKIVIKPKNKESDLKTIILLTE